MSVNVLQRKPVHPRHGGIQKSEEVSVEWTHLQDLTKVFGYLFEWLPGWQAMRVAHRR